jgi:hypothetical protein
MNAPFLVCFVLCIGFAVAAVRAIRLDRADEYHLMHGPNSGCVECEDK